MLEIQEIKMEITPEVRTLRDLRGRNFSLLKYLDMFTARQPAGYSTTANRRDQFAPFAFTADEK